MSVEEKVFEIELLDNNVVDDVKDIIEEYSFNEQGILKLKVKIVSDTNYDVYRVYLCKDNKEDMYIFSVSFTYASDMDDDELQESIIKHLYYYIYS